MTLYSTEYLTETPSIHSGRIFEGVEIGIAHQSHRHIVFAGNAQLTLWCHKVCHIKDFVSKVRG
jgi:hypothetical protein